MKQTALLLTVVLVLAGCDSNGAIDAPEPVVDAVWVANGGNFSDQNGSLSRLSVPSGKVMNGPALDGFIQAVEPAGVELLVLIDTFSGGRVAIYEADGRVARAILPDMPAPRAAVVQGNRAYVTAWQSDGTGSVHVVDIAAGTLGDTPFLVGSYPEGIAELAGRLLVANSGFLGSGTTLSAISLADGSVTEVPLGCDGPRDVVVIPGEDVAVVCHGKTVYSADWSEILEQTNAQIVFLDGATLQVEDRLRLDVQVGSTGGAQAAAASLDELAILEGNSNTIRRVDLVTRQELAPWSFSSDGTYVGLSGIAAGTDGWYVGRMARAAGGSFPDFTAAGALLLLATDGTVTATHPVGSAPNHVTIHLSED